MKYKMTTARSLTAAITLFGSLVGGANAAISVVDTPDGKSITPTHNDPLGDWIALVTNAEATTGSLSISSSAHIGLDGSQSPTIGFSDGADFEPTFTTDFLLYAAEGFGFVNGADSGINYARLDLDQNGVYETVVEFDFGTNDLLADDVITRYAYDDEGSDLTVSAAFSSVPEPSSTLLLGLGSFCLVLRRSR